MGANPSQDPTQAKILIQFQQKIDYVMETSNPNFGTFKVYKMSQKPYQYIMRKDYTSLIGDLVLQKRKERYQKIPKHKNLVNFDFISLRQVEERCSRHLELFLFCRYYFFSLEEAILKKLKRQTKFSDQQVYYVAKTAFAVYQTLHSHEDMQYGLFQTSSIFLTPEGFIKIYPAINDWKEEVMLQSQFTHNSRRFFSFTTENEVELDLSKQRKDFAKKQKHISDIFDIGVILLSMISMAKQSDYRTSDGDIKEDIVKFIINSSQEIENRTLAIFKNLLKGIFEEKWTFSKLKQELQSIEIKNTFKSTTRIKIINENNEDSAITMSGQQFDRQKQSRLKMIPKSQLIPGKIRCYSASVNSQS